MSVPRQSSGLNGDGNRLGVTGTPTDQGGQRLERAVEGGSGIPRVKEINKTVASDFGG